MSEADHNPKSTDVKYKNVPDFPGYLVGSDGSVWSRWKWKARPVVLSKKWRRLKPSRSNKGYLHIAFIKDGKRTQFLIHRLVLVLFADPCLTGMETRHLDGDPSNNNIKNLRWGTGEENCQDRCLHGTAPVGERNGQAKLRKKDVAEIRKRYTVGNETHRSLAREFGVSHQNINDIVRGKLWNH